MAENAKKGLIRISAIELAKLVERAIKIYKNQDRQYQNKRNPEFNNLDDEFYDMEDQLEKFQIKYIRSNYELFIIE